MFHVFALTNVVYLHDKPTKAYF